MPPEPLAIAWVDSTGKHQSFSLSMTEILRNFEVYGGRLELKIVDDNIEVWLAEPDKATDPNNDFWNKKPSKRIYSTRLQE